MCKYKYDSWISPSLYNIADQTYLTPCLAGTLRGKRLKILHHFAMVLTQQQKTDTGEKVPDLLLMLVQKWDCILSFYAMFYMSMHALF